MKTVSTLTNLSRPIELSLIVAVSYHSITDDLQALLKQNLITAKITSVSSLEELENELKKNNHDFIITEYSLSNADIWKIAKLVHSNQLSKYAVPIYVINDDGLDIPGFLAKEHGFKVVNFSVLGDILRNDHFENISYKRVNGFNVQNHLLAIEDDEDAAELIRFNLSDTYQIDVASTGEDGLELWLEKRHDLILLDYNLPSMQGDKVLDKIMSIDKNQPVIIMTAYDLPDRNRDMIIQGASEYLCKPFEMDVLKERCQHVLSKARHIYQLSYSESKFESLGNLLWLVDYYLGRHEYDKARRAIDASRQLVPFVPPEDDQYSLLGKEG